MQLILLKTEISLLSHSVNGLFVPHIAYLRQQWHNSKFVIFQENLLKVLKYCNFYESERRHNCSPAASFANCFMTLYLLKVYLQTFLSTPKTQKCHILSCDILVANERHIWHSGMSHFTTTLYRYTNLQVETARGCTLVQAARCGLHTTEPWNESRLRARDFHSRRGPKQVPRRALVQFSLVIVILPLLYTYLSSPPPTCGSRNRAAVERLFSTSVSVDLGLMRVLR